MPIDERFDDLIATLGGFHRTWLIYLGLELGLFAALRDAGRDGLTTRPAGQPRVCARGDRDVGLGGRCARARDARGRPAGHRQDIATILLDETRAEYLGGQFIHATVASLDWGGMVEFFRTGTGTSVTDRPDRYRVAIEHLTTQDIAVFFQEALAALPQLVVDLSAGGRVVDIHCGGGRWLIAMARRFPALELVGVEFEEDSVARARANVAAAGLEDRIHHPPRRCDKAG